MASHYVNDVNMGIEGFMSDHGDALVERDGLFIDPRIANRIAQFSIGGDVVIFYKPAVEGSAPTIAVHLDGGPSPNLYSADVRLSEEDFETIKQEYAFQAGGLFRNLFGIAPPISQSVPEAEGPVRGILLPIVQRVREAHPEAAPTVAPPRTVYHQLLQASQEYNFAYHMSGDYRASPLYDTVRAQTDPFHLIGRFLGISSDENRSRRAEVLKYFEDSRSYAYSLASGDTSVQKPVAPSFLAGMQEEVTAYERDVLEDGRLRVKLVKTAKAIFEQHPNLIQALTGQNLSQEEAVEWVIKTAEDLGTRSIEMPTGLGTEGPSIFVPVRDNYSEIFKKDLLGTLTAVSLGSPTTVAVPAVSTSADPVAPEASAVDTKSEEKPREAATSETTPLETTRHFTITVNKNGSLTEAVVREQQGLMNEILTRLPAGSNDKDAALVTGLILASAAGIKNANQVAAGPIQVDITDQQIQSAIDSVTTTLASSGNDHATSLYNNNQPLVPQRIVGDLRAQR